MALPEVGDASPVRMLMSVLFPAPLGPRSPKKEPAGIVTLIPLSASTAPYFLERETAAIAGVDVRTGLPVARRGVEVPVDSEQRLQEPPALVRREGVELVHVVEVLGGVVAHELHHLHQAVVRGSLQGAFLYPGIEQGPADELRQSLGRGHGAIVLRRS